MIGLSADFAEEIVSMLSECITPTLDDFKIEYDCEVFESIFPDQNSLPCVFKDEIFNLHMFLKQEIQMNEISDSSRLVRISYFDSKLKTKVN